LESAPAQRHGNHHEENPMMKNLISACLLSLGLLAGNAAFAADAKATCEVQAGEKKLAGAAKNSYVKKCVKDAGGSAAASPSCEKSAADKKLAGAAKNSHIKKCMADEKTGAKPAAAAAPAAKPVAAAPATPAAPAAKPAAAAAPASAPKK
jgi:hypothetical protein